MTGGFVTKLSALKVWESFRSLAPTQLYPAGTKLFRQGSSTLHVFLIDRGLVKLIRFEQEGDEIIVGLRYPGWILGAASAILEKPYPVTAATLMPTCLHRLPTKEFLRLLATDLQVSSEVHRLHSRELYEQTAQLAELGSASARQRLEHLLWRLVTAREKTQSKKRVHLPPQLKLWEIAELIAITPEHLSRVLKQMQREGVIFQDKGMLIVADSERLWHPTLL